MDRIEPVGSPGDRSSDPARSPAPGVAATAPSSATAQTPPRAQTPSAQDPSAAQTPSDTSNYLSPSSAHLPPRGQLPQQQQQPQEQQQKPQRPGTRARRPSVRIQRLSSASSLTNASTDNLGSPLPSNQRQSQATLDDSTATARTSTRSPDLRNSYATVDEDEAWQGRRRSSSEPRPGRWSSPSPIALTRISTPMVPLTEEVSNNSRRGAHRSSSNIISNDDTNNHLNTNTDAENDTDSAPFPDFQPNNEKPSVPATPDRPKTGRLRRTSQAAMNRFSRSRASTLAGPVPKVTDGEHRYRRTNEQNNDNSRDDEYGPEFVNMLDVIDPEVSALSTLTNVQNSLFVPDLFGFVNREPTYTLSRPTAEPVSEEEGATTDASEQQAPGQQAKPKEERPSITRARDTSISAVLDEGDTRFAVLPEQSSLEGWTKEDVEELNDHVRHMLHSRRSKFKRGMKGFGKYVSKPLGFFITLYATLITLFGLAWVLFLIGWVNVGGKQLYVINVIDNVLVALFAIMGDGLAPFRAVDTYHMIFIARYTFLTWKIREKRDLPELKNKNDLPTRREMDVDVEWGETPKDEQYEFSVLNRTQQLRLIHHQNKFAKSHTFYKPHETITHHAFPTRLLVAIVVVLDCHSMLQIALGSCTWSIDYHVRPFALTTVILCCSICCNITGGVLITIGDRMTRKKDVVERMFRQQLTSEAMKLMQKRRRREEKRNSSLSQIQSRQSRPSTTLSPQATTPYEGT